MLFKYFFKYGSVSSFPFSFLNSWISLKAAFLSSYNSSLYLSVKWQ
jgi:hypothetical protein